MLMKFAFLVFNVIFTHMMIFFVIPEISKQYVADTEESDEVESSISLSIFYFLNLCYFWL